MTPDSWRRASALRWLLGAALLSAPAAAAQGRITTAKTETRSAAQGVAREVQAIAARGVATWIGYRAPMVSGPRQMCCCDTIGDAGNCCGRCRLDGGSGVSMSQADSRVSLEPPTEFLVLARVDGGALMRLRTFTPDCDIEAARTDKSTRVRGQALFWLAHKAGDKAVSTITNAIANDPETEVKKKAVFALSQLPRDEGVPRLIEVARTNRNPEVRKQAMFWLGQSHDLRAVQFFEQILTSK